MTEKILIIDFGSQVTQLIGRRLRELNVYCEIHPFNKVPEIDGSVKGIILSGSPCSVRDAGAPQINLEGIKGRRSRRFRSKGIRACPPHRQRQFATV